MSIEVTGAPPPVAPRPELATTRSEAPARIPRQSTDPAVTLAAAGLAAALRPLWQGAPTAVLETATDEGVVAGSSAAHQLASTLPRRLDGAPDFAAIVAAGGSVRGAIPPAGDSSWRLVDEHVTTYYVAEVQLTPDSPTIFVKGAVLTARPPQDEASALAYGARVSRRLADLPDSMAQARLRSASGPDPDPEPLHYDLRL